MPTTALAFTTSASDQLVKYTTPLERQTIAEWIREALADEEEEIAGSQRQAYGKLWLDLEKESLDDEAYLRICRETGRTSDLVDRLLTLGRIDEAARETQRVDDYALLGTGRSLRSAWTGCRGRAPGESAHHRETGPAPPGMAPKILSDAGATHAAELEVAETLFRTQPFLRHYQELRDLARRLDRWETLRPELLAFLEQAQEHHALDRDRPG